LSQQIDRPAAGERPCCRPDRG